MARDAQCGTQRPGATVWNPDGRPLTRDRLKRGAERVLSSSLVTRITRARLRGKRLILAYHGIAPAEESASPVGERALFVGQRAFAAQLDMIAGQADVVPLAELDHANGDAADRLRVAITFDDAYQGAVTCGVDELERRAFPVTFFVAPGRLDGHGFWWDALAGDDGTLVDGVREFALGALAGDDERVRAWARAAGVPAASMPRYARSATVDELRTASVRPGVTLGSHTWSHVNLAAADAAQVASELQRSRLWLTERFGDRCIPWLAYPYGLESVPVRAAAATAGYQAAVLIRGGWYDLRDESPFARPRLNVSAGMSVNGLKARVLGAILTARR